VVQHPEELVGVARDGTRIVLSREEIAITKLDCCALSKMLCAALGLESAPQGIEPVGPAHFVGTFERLGIRHPVYLLITADDGRFAAALNQLVLSNVLPFVVLTPTSKRLGRAFAERFPKERVCVVSLSDVIVAMADGTLLPSRHPESLLTAIGQAAVGGQPRANGVYPPNTLVFAGREFSCNMTKIQMKFLDIGVRKREVSASEVMNRKTGVVWERQYVNEKSTNDVIHQFCTRLNNVLMDANTGMSFSFNAATGHLVRLDPVWAADLPLTEN
jgi:hypothetical protein